MLPFLSGRGWGKVLKRERRQSRGIVRWLATITFVLLLAVWIASIWVFASLARNFTASPTQPQYWIFVYAGRVYIGENRIPGGGYGVETAIEIRTPRMAWSFAYRDSQTYCRLIIPLWAPTLIAGVTAAWCWKRERHRRQLAKIGSCPACGYSRDGLTANAPCPECGVQ